MSFFGCASAEHKADVREENQSIIDTSEVFSITEITPEEYHSKKNNCKDVEFDTSLVKKVNGRVELKLNKSTIILQDEIGSEENQIFHKYLGFINFVDRHLIETIYYEGIKYVLISPNNNQTEIWSKPIFSSDKKYFFCFKSYGLEGDNLGLQIWEIKKDNQQYPDTFSLNKIFELNQLIFSPNECFWDGRNLLIKGQNISNHLFPNEESVTHYWKMKF
jgi:hypothetical protein